MRRVGKELIPRLEHLNCYIMLPRRTKRTKRTQREARKTPPMESSICCVHMYEYIIVLVYVRSCLLL